MEPLTKDQEEQQSLLAVLSQALQQSNFDSLNAVNELNQAILSCLQHVITGSLRTSDFIRVVREIMPENDSSWVTNGILSSLWILASQIKVLSLQSIAGGFNTPSNSLAAMLKDLITSDLVDANALKSTMELSSLVDGGILKEDEQAVQKRIIKLNTGLVYKQQKYNLLREETEGYSKLVLVLNNVPHLTDNIINTKNDSIIPNVVLYAESIIGIIGQFDLDPNRVFDIILDAFEQQPLNYAFSEILRILRPTNLVHTLGFKLLHYYEHTLTPTEKPIASPVPSKSVLGSKSNVEIKTNTDEKTDTSSLETIPTSHALLDVAAMLIISNLISLEDLVPYLHPSVDETKDFVESSKASLDQLVSSTKLDIKTSKGIIAMKHIIRSHTDIEQLNSIQKNQVIGLLTALVRLHGWEDAQHLASIIGLPMSCIVNTIQPVRKALISLFTWCIDGLENFYGFQAVLTDSTYNLASRSASVGSISSKQAKQLKSLDDLLSTCWEWIELLKHHMVEDSKLFSKLCRLLKALILQSNNSAGLFKDVSSEKEISDDKLFQVLLLLLQGLSVSGNDSTYFSAQVWQVLSLLTFQDRFALYELWKRGGFLSGEQERPTMVIVIESFAMNFCRSQMKRLAKENAKQIGQKLAKFMHANPTIFIQHVLNQVENFDNLIPYIVEAMKYSTDLSRDVFAACILLQLKKTEADTKIKEGDTHYVQWFSALSKFIGTFYCKYPNTEIKGLFSYLLQSYSNGNASDLLLLKDLLGIMGGCETLLEVSPNQLEGLGGGKGLRAEAMNLASSVAMSANKANSQVLPTKRSSIVLREELISSGAAMPLLLFIAQIRSNVLFESSNRHLKLISHFYDTAQDLMMQFAEFLIAEAKSVDAIAKLMPDFRVLLEEVGLSIPIAFQLVRPLLRHGLQQQKSSSEFGSPPVSNKRNWHPFNNNIIEMIEAQAPMDGIVGKLSTKLTIYFWTLSLYDISVPTERYHGEIKTIKDRWTELESKKGSTTAASMQMNPSEFSKWSKQRDADMKQMMQIINVLSDELTTQQKHTEKMKETLLGEKDQFLSLSADNEANVNEHLLTDLLLQNLVLKRVLMSPVDAVYCIRFCKLLYDIRVPNFCIFDFFNKFIACILPLLFASTETEAKFIGHALTEVLLMLNRWYLNEEQFNLENSNKVISFEELLEMDPNTGAKRLSYKLFQSLYKKWHSRILEVVVGGINGKEFMYIRSSLVLLSKVSLQFPFIKSEALKLLQRIKKLESEEDDREDLQLMAKSVYIVITRQSTIWFDDIPHIKPIETKQRAKRAPSVDFEDLTPLEIPKAIRKEVETNKETKSQKEVDGGGAKRKAPETEAAPPSKFPKSSHSSVSDTFKASNRSSESNATKLQSIKNSSNDADNQKVTKPLDNKERSNDRRGSGIANVIVGGRNSLSNPSLNPPNLSTPQFNQSSNSNYQSKSSTNNYHSAGGHGGAGNYHNNYNSNHNGGLYHSQQHYESSSRYHESARHDYDSSNYNRHSRQEGYSQQSSRGSRNSYNEGQAIPASNSTNSASTANAATSINNSTSNSNNTNKRQRK